MQGVLLHRVAGRQDRDPGEKGVLTDMTGYNSGHVRSRNNSVPFVHLRVHSEFSVVDGIVRIPDLIKRVAKLGQPAVALTDLSNLFGLIVLQGARRRDQAHRRLRRLDHQRRRSRQAVPPAVAGAQSPGLPEPVRAVDPVLPVNQGKGRAEIRREWLQGQEGLIALSGGRMGDVGQALDAGNAVSALALARQWALLFPGSYYIELQRAGFDGDEATPRRPCGWRPRPACRWWPRIRCSSGRARIPGPRGPRLHRRRRDPPIRAACAASPRINTCSVPRKCTGATPTCPRRWPTRSRSPSAAT